MCAPSALKKGVRVIASSGDDEEINEGGTGNFDAAAASSAAPAAVRPALPSPPRPAPTTVTAGGAVGVDAAASESAAVFQLRSRRAEAEASVVSLGAGRTTSTAVHPVSRVPLEATRPSSQAS
jgi:hypothetical protein